MINKAINTVSTIEFVLNNYRKICLLIFVWTFFTIGLFAQGSYDLIIRNGRIIDGTGNPWFRADVGIRDDVIAEVGALGSREAVRTIEAGDRILSPGFIDMMGQSSLVLITDPPSAESKLRQGITTYLSGEGGSAAPQSTATQSSPLVINGDSVRWTTYAEYFEINL